MSEQQTMSACPHPEAVGTRWGDPIRRGAEGGVAGLYGLLGSGDGLRGADGPVDGEDLTGADEFWLAANVVARTEGNVADAEASLRNRDDSLLHFPVVHSTCRQQHKRQRTLSGSYISYS